MCEITIPPAPGWYLSNILGCNDDGTVLAYGAKHEIVLLRPVPSRGSTWDLQPSFIAMAHKDRIVALCFSPSSGLHSTHLATCSDDGTVRVWDWTTESLILSHSGHGDNHKVIGVDWSRADVNMVVSVADDASLICWDLQSNTIRRLFLGAKISPIVVNCCPHDKELVAIGAKSGLTIIYNVKGEGKVLHRLRGHETDVVSLSWCPVKTNVFKDDNKENVCLLATGAKDKSIYIWRAGTDGRYETFVNLPSTQLATYGYRAKAGLGATGTHWICVRWIEPNSLLTSSTYGELIEYDLSKKTVDKEGRHRIKPPRLIHGLHSKGLFTIAAPLRPQNPQNRVVWSYALDKHLIGVKSSSGNIVVDATTIGGIVYCLASSPSDLNRIAIGTGDNKILVWNTSNDNVDKIVTFWNKINSKVMALAWHPTQDSILAFGTGEGRIGIIDVSKQNPTPKLFRQYHRRSVYSLIWASPVVDISDRKIPYALFSVGDGDILQHNPETPDKEPINMSSYFKQCDASAMVSKALGRTDLAWNHDGTLAAVGNDTGVLYIVDGHTFNHVHTIFAHKKLVQCTVWHPSSVTTEDSLSPFRTWLASASDNIQIINVTKAGVDVIASLNTHSEKVVSLAWSPHFNGRLISASYDYTSQVWDVASGSVLACFDGHHASVVCCVPSALHQDWVITGSADNTVRVWNVNNFRLTRTKTKQQRLSGVLKKFASAREATELSVPEHYPHVNGSARHVEFVLPPEHKRKSKSMFPVTSSGLSQSRHLSLLWSRVSGGPLPPIPPSNSGYLDFFSDSQSMRRLALVEETHHKEQAHDYNADLLSLWSGNISETIKEACAKKRLNEWLVSTAPMVSHKLWVDCCRCYASQLAESGDVLRAVSYYLTVHLVTEAVDLLLDAKMYKEAVCLAKLRFPPNDIMVKKAMTQWAYNAVGNGMLSLAAHCMISIGSNIEAVEILGKSKDPELLALAADIATKAQANEMALSLAMRAINAALETKNYSVARNTCLKHWPLEDLLLWVEVCELRESWVAKEEAIIVDWLRNKVPAQKLWPGLYERAFELCKVKLISHAVLSKFLPNKPTSDSKQKMWVYIAGQISLAAASQLKSNGRQVLKHLILAMEAGYNFHLYHSATNPYFYPQLCVWILPWGPLGTLPELESNVSLLESFCSFFAVAVVYWMDRLNVNNAFPEDDEAFHDIETTVLKSASLLFHKDILLYHKTDVEIKKLEGAVASAKLKALKAMKSCKDIEAKLQTTDATVATTEAARNDEEDDVKRLARLKTLKEDFENERVAVANPFIAFCTLRSVLTSLAAKRPAAARMLEEVKSLWSKSLGENDSHQSAST